MLTVDEIERRRQFITATDVAKLLRKCPPQWGGPADVYWDKVGGRPFTGNAATEAGTLLEPSVIQWAHQRLGGVVSGDWRVHENGINACSLDAMTLNGEPVEAKTSGIVGPGTPHQWGEEGTDQIPEYYLCQVHAQLLITGARRAYVPALIGGRGFVMFVVRSQPEINEKIRQVCEQFWNEHVLPRIAPDGVSPTLETLKYLRRKPGKTAKIDPALIEEYTAAKAEEKAVDVRVKAAQAALLNALGDAEAGESPAGSFTYFEQTNPEHMTKESTFRVLRMKAPKKGLVTA